MLLEPVATVQPPSPLSPLAAPAGERSPDGVNGAEMTHAFSRGSCRSRSFRVGRNCGDFSLLPACKSVRFVRWAVERGPHAWPPGSAAVELGPHSQPPPLSLSLLPDCFLLPGLALGSPDRPSVLGPSDPCPLCTSLPCCTFLHESCVQPCCPRPPSA